ncbi:MAG TPA: hypothetical protein VII58_10590 [Acidobacteriaceae bacterium]
MRFPPAVALIAVFALAGCHSRYITATIINNTAGPLSPVEVDYPSASFGRESLAPGATYQYRFKIIGSGATTVLWTDASHHDHKSPGPQLHEGDEGSLAITIKDSAAPVWDLRLVHRGS